MASSTLQATDHSRSASEIAHDVFDLLAMLQALSARLSELELLAMQEDGNITVDECGMLKRVCRLAERHAERIGEELMDREFAPEGEAP